MPSAHELTTIGWNDAVARRWADGRTHGLVPARVARTDRGVITVWPRPGVEVRATTTTAAKDTVAGDWVGLDPLIDRVDRILERSSAFVRRGARNSHRPQTIAANMDVVLLVEAADPKVNQQRLERALVLAHQSGAEPVVVVTKIDLTDDRGNRAVADATEVSGGVDVIAISNTTGRGLDALRSRLTTGTTVAALGASGVGKSSLVNALSGAQVQLTGGVRRGDAKGKHTTTASQLIAVDDLLIIDTPGIRAIALWGDGTGLDLTFPEIAAAAARCRFDDCQHDNEPDCAVRAGVAAGEIDRRRLDHYLQLWGELSA